MHRFTVAAATLLASPLAGLLCPPALAADAMAGEQLARTWCAACHLVAADQERAPELAPPFAAIAKQPGFDLERLTRAMQWPHPAMPGRELSRDEAADIAAYIATLAK